MVGRIVDLRQGALGLANINTEHSVKFKFQIKKQVDFQYKYAMYGIYLH